MYEGSRGSWSQSLLWDSSHSLIAVMELTLFLRPQSRIADFEGAAMPHLADIYRSASFLVRNSLDAEDLVQEVYLEAWKSFHRFELGTNCRAVEPGKKTSERKTCRCGTYLRNPTGERAWR